MKVLCKKSMYLFQDSGYSPLYHDKQTMGGKKGILIFKMGRGYEIVPIAYKDTLEWVKIYAIGEDGKAHVIFKEQVCYCGTRDALRHFHFERLDKSLEHKKA